MVWDSRTVAFLGSPCRAPEALVYLWPVRKQVASCKLVMVATCQEAKCLAASRLAVAECARTHPSLAAGCRRYFRVLAHWLSFYDSGHHSTNSSPRCRCVLGSYARFRPISCLSCLPSARFVVLRPGRLAGDSDLASGSDDSVLDIVLAIVSELMLKCGPSWKHLDF